MMKPIFTTKSLIGLLVSNFKLIKLNCRTETIQNRSLEMKSKISNYQENFKNTIEIEIQCENSEFDSCLSWLEKQKSILHEENFPSESNKIQSEIAKTQNIQTELNTFRENYLKDFDKDKNDNFKYCLNELEILYNFTYVIN